LKQLKVEYLYFIFSLLFKIVLWYYRLLLLKIGLKLPSMLVWFVPKHIGKSSSRISLSNGKMVLILKQKCFHPQRIYLNVRHVVLLLLFMYHKVE
jgi:hypothetical protein